MPRSSSLNLNVGGWRRILSKVFADAPLGTHKLNVSSKTCYSVAGKGKIPAGWTVVSVNMQDFNKRLRKRRKRRRRNYGNSKEDVNVMYKFLLRTEERGDSRKILL
jgi:hypothetical protein